MSEIYKKYIKESGEGEGLSWDISPDSIDRVKKYIDDNSTKSESPSGKPSFVIKYLGKNK